MATSGAVAKPNSSAPSSAPKTHVAPGLELPVDLQAHAPAQAVQDEHLLRLGEARAPTGGPAWWIDVSGDAPVPPSWPTDEDGVGVRLGDARGDGADARLGDELDADARAAG